MLATYVATSNRFTEYVVAWLRADGDARELVATTIHLGIETAARALEDSLRGDSPLDGQATLFGDLLDQAIRSVDWVTVAQVVAETLQ